VSLFNKKLHKKKRVCLLKTSLINEYHHYCPNFKEIANKEEHTQLKWYEK